MHITGVVSFSLLHVATTKKSLPRRQHRAMISVSPQTLNRSQHSRVEKSRDTGLSIAYLLPRTEKVRAAYSDTHAIVSNGRMGRLAGT